MARYSAHAKRRMLERSISEEEVRATVDHPLETVQTRYGRTAACAKAEEKYIVVVLEQGAGDLIVATALKVDKERARRYGFNRVRPRS